MTQVGSDAPQDRVGYWPDDPPNAAAPHPYACPPFVLPIRHLPTRSEIALASRVGGSAGAALLERWRALVSSAVGDVEAFSERLGQRTEAGVAQKRAEAERTLRGLSRPLAAEITAALERQADAPEPRPPALHVLEDAARHVHLHEAGADYAYVGAAFGLGPDVLSGSRGLPFRLLDPAGAAPDQERHAAVVRIARSMGRQALPYWRSPAFRALAGRRMAEAEGATHLGAILVEMADQGHAKAFLKHATSKRGTWVADLPRGATIDGMCVAAHAAMGHGYASLHAGADESLRQVLVQEFLPFTHEHRFLVVGHRVVASTPSDRALGILDAVPGRILRPGLARLLRPAAAAGAYDRGAAETVDDRGLLARMAGTARRAAKAFRREGFLPHSYCLDVGLSARGVLPIEVNALNHCGLYAADWSRAARALARLPSPAGRPDAALCPDFMIGRDKVEDSLDFLLDVLMDEPPSVLADVAARLTALAAERNATTARAMGVLARDAHLRELEAAPVDPRLVDAARDHLDPGKP